jgi:streptogramin lyase
MMIRRILIAGLILLGMLLFPLLVKTVLAALAVQEMPLNPTGLPFEINLDSQGFLWVSDNTSGEIWQVAAADGSYTIYPVGGGPSDARSDGAGSLWWSDSMSGQVGRLDISNGASSTWEIPGSSGLYGTALDGAGGLWVTDSGLPYLYHLRPTASEVCTYTLPLDGFSNYPLVAGSLVWLGDRENSQILRLDTASQTFTGWQLPAGSRPNGMALDGSGSLWWADTNRGLLGRLNPSPSSNQVITYTQTTLQSPQMLTLADGKVWYSDQNGVGMLDPARFFGTASTITPYTQPGTPKCAQIAAPTTSTITPTPGQASWSDVTYPSLSSPNGWQVFQLPTGASTWGIAAQGEHIWLVDQGRRVLARFSKKIETQIFLPLIVK